ncbi:hypothetical protein K501DRAFT_265605 [Backusella circina FSU 941]|nr:hypothetical protein K501DRAFT_265605 [Backusella circina FSU 941]
MEERYMQANEIVMSEPYMEEVVDEIDLDEDPAFTYAEDEDVVPEMQGKFKPENETDEGSFVVAYDDNNQQLAYEAYRPESIKKFIRLLQEEGGSVAKHAKSCFIPRSTTYGTLKQWNEGDETVILPGCIKRPSKD